MKKGNKDQSFHGNLIMAANSLGNPKDIPLRALEYAAKADLLVFEEDRMARQVLKAAGLIKPYLKFNEHFQKDTLDTVRDSLKAGNTVLYMSDQGSPCLDDPGKFLVQEAMCVPSQITVIPGPSSLTAALSACPFDISAFYYAGFLPREEEKRQNELQQLAKINKPLVFLDTPYRLHDVLNSCKIALGETWQGFLAVDISGEEEAYFYGSFAHLLTKVNKEKKLNFVLITAHRQKSLGKLPHYG
jgi:16S rRNA (cytidine1402-2'-O)-methyltransferase